VIIDRFLYLQTKVAKAISGGTDFYLHFCDVHHSQKSVMFVEEFQV